MAKIQAYVSDEVVEKINVIVEKRKAEGAKEKDISFSSISTMLLELGLRDMKLRWNVKSLVLIRWNSISLCLEM